MSAPAPAGGSAGVSAMATLRYRLRMHLGARAATLPLFPLLSSEARAKRLAVAPDTEVCVEGYPRSANSYFTWCLRDANPGLRVAHHLHVPGNVLAALDRGLPAALLIRPPEDAALSLMVGLRGAVDCGALLAGYADFHRRLLPVMGRCVVSDFPTSTQAPETVIAAINARFGRDYALRGPGENALTAFSLHAAEHARRRRNDDMALVTAPDPRKEQAKTRYRAALLAHPRLPEARALYRAARDFAIAPPAAAARS